MIPSPTLLVAAGVVIQHGTVLLTQRKAGAHLAGRWEFPGGKVEPGEDPRAALRRELHEELGIDVVVGEILDVTFHRYEEAGRTVLLLFFEAERTATSADPRAIDVAGFEWAGASRLSPERFPKPTSRWWRRSGRGSPALGADDRRTIPRESSSEAH